MKTGILGAPILGESGRLDAKYYLSSAVYASGHLQGLKKKGIECISLSTLGKVWNPLRFKRAYAAEQEDALPYLRPYDVFEYLPTATSFLSVKRNEHIETYRLREGTILQTCSGRNLGPLTMVDKYIAQFILGDDIMRIEIEDEEVKFYTIAYLKSQIGQTLLKRGKTGSVIDHLSEKHIGNQEIPLFGKETQLSVSTLMRSAFQLREKARLTLQAMLTEYEKTLPMPKHSQPKREGWAIRSVTLTDRLDAAFHDPFVAEIRQQLINIGGIPVHEVATVLKPGGRYKTVYVDSQYGRPILSGTQLLQEQPIHLQFIAPRSFKEMALYELKTKWVAYQADGRVEKGLGTPSFITSDRNGWLASGHVGRLIPKPHINPGWLYLAVKIRHSQLQIKAMASGSVVDSTFEEDMANVILPPQYSVDGNKVCEMWELFVEARQKEDQAIRMVEEKIEELT